MCLHRAKSGPKIPMPAEIRRLNENAPPSLKAMILLGINCGFGNGGCANLPPAAVNLDTGWIDDPRPKTGIPRRCPLWPETVQAIRTVIAEGREPKEAEAAGLLFLTHCGKSWVRAAVVKTTGKDGSAKVVTDDAIAKEFAKLRRKLKLNTSPGHSFYILRHSFRTVANETKDPMSADHIMGNETPNMSSVYRETISDEWLKAVADHVRNWLFKGERLQG
jgi:integrase